MKKNIHNGFTLIEILIASAIFVSIISIALAVLGFGVNLQSRNSAVREASQTARFIIEAISRDVRLADSYYIDPSGQKVTIFKNESEYSYYWDPIDKTIYFQKGANEDALNPKNVKIENLIFDGIDYKISDAQSYLQIQITFKSELGKRSLDSQTQTIKTAVATRAYIKGY